MNKAVALASALFAVIGLALPVHEAMLPVIAVASLAWLEEAIFRKYIFHKICPTGSYPLAAIISSIIFGLLHLANGPRDAAISFFFGLALCTIYYALPRLMLVSSIHFTNNMIAMSTNFDFMEHKINKDLCNGIFSLCLLVTLVAAFCLIAIEIFKATRSKL